MIANIPWDTNYHSSSFILEKLYNLYIRWNWTLSNKFVKGTLKKFKWRKNIHVSESNIRASDVTSNRAPWSLSIVLFTPQNNAGCLIEKTLNIKFCFIHYKQPTCLKCNELCILYFNSSRWYVWLEMMARNKIIGKIFVLNVWRVLHTRLCYC